MRSSLIEDMLLIQEPSVMVLYREMNDIALNFLPAMFLLGILFAFLTDMDFVGVLKKLLLVTLFISSFQMFHEKAVELSLESATKTLRKVSPRNLFVKRWAGSKVTTSKQENWNILESISIPNLNDLLGTAFFLLSKVFIWLLKLIYSSVYHLTYVFSGVTAVLHFLGWTKDALKGTIQASLWCILLPFVLVAILALVGNSIDTKAINGELMITNINSVIWLFGVTLLLLMAPVITFGIIRGEGVHSFGAKMGSMVVSSGMKAATVVPLVQKIAMKRRKANEFNAAWRPRD